eukprot:172261-Pyramimonas_sp.AAC.1
MSSQKGITACSTQQADMRGLTEEEEEETEPVRSLAIRSTERSRILFKIGAQPEVQEVPKPRTNTVMINRVQVFPRSRRSASKEATSSLTVKSRTRVERG